MLRGVERKHVVHHTSHATFKEVRDNLAPAGDGNRLRSPWMNDSRLPLSLLISHHFEQPEAAPRSYPVKVDVS